MSARASAVFWNCPRPRLEFVVTPVVDGTLTASTAFFFFVMHINFTLSQNVILTSLLGCLLLESATHAQSPAQVLALPEIIVTSFRGRVSTDKAVTGTVAHQDMQRRQFPFDLTPPATGAPFNAVHITPGTRLAVNSDSTSHAVISLPGAGACMITAGSSLRLPAANETGITVSFDHHYSGGSKLFLNLSTAEMARHGGAVFRFTNDGRTLTTPRPNVIFSTQGGRFFVIDAQTTLPLGATGAREDFTMSCTVGAFDGSLTVEELTSKQRFEIKAGQVVVITPAGISKPRPPTKAELSYDIGCKLAVLGREVPARLPPTMKTTAPTSLPGTRVNSLGMVFVPVPGTKVLMCVHETRGQDYAPYMATVPPVPDGKSPSAMHGLWGWEDHPVTTTWDDAEAFCTWLSQKEGKKYRLPTDEEWSHAVGIGTKEKRGPNTNPEELGKQGINIFPWGSAWPPPAGAGNLRDVSRDAENLILGDQDLLLHYDDGFAQTAPVMSFKPNNLGIYDLAGNVAEWCSDWLNNSRQHRVVRGGYAGYTDGDRFSLQSSFRFSPPASSRSTDSDRRAGFRVVLELP